MKYQVRMKAQQDVREIDRVRGNALCEERNGHRYGIWFDTIEEAKEACIQHNAYCIIDDEFCEPVWYNPDYESESFENLKKHLSKKFMPRI